MPLCPRSVSRIAALKRGREVTSAHCPTARHAAADPARAPRRFRLISSPMRRALKTTSALVAGLDKVRLDPCFVEVDPFCFEEGGCYHSYPDFMDETGLSALQAMLPAELDALASSSPDPVTFSGLKADEVSDPATLALALDIDVGRASFVRSVLPGMEQGWYAGQNGHVETRGDDGPGAKICLCIHTRWLWLMRSTMWSLCPMEIHGCYTKGAVCGPAAAADDTKDGNVSTPLCVFATQTLR